MSDYRAGFVGVIGQPNAGKSSFLNKMVKEKVSIVTAKPQTTRQRSLGIVTLDEGQIVFVDAPGLVKPKGHLNLFLRNEMDDVVQSSDILLAVLSIDEKTAEDLEEVIKVAKESRKRWFAFINKTDLAEKAHRVPILIQKITEAGGVYFTGNCNSEDGIPKAEILEALLKALPVGKGPLYDPEMYTPHSIRDLACEIVREKCFEFLHQEVPYGLAVRIIKFDEKDIVPRIYFEILVDRESHKSIVIGKGGEKIKEIATHSRKDIEKLMDQQIYMEVQVSFKENWTKNKRIMEELGYVVDKQ